jgi:pimeloyl-ACP methyl ester carboxylesterase
MLRVFKDDAARARYVTAYDAVLREWPVPYESLYLPTRFGTTHVVASGPRDAPPVLLFPALLTTATSWKPNIETLSQRFRTYAVDVIGEINMSEPVRPLKNKRDCSEWVSDLLNSLQIKRASLVGASLGGFFALDQAVLDPDRIEKIVLISPANVLPMTWKLFYYGALSGIGIGGPLDKWMGGGIPWDPSNNSSGALWAANREGAGSINDFSLGSISEEEWRTVRAPTLLLIGDKEVIYGDPPAKVMASALQRFPGLEGEIVPRANHLAARANPQFVDDRVVRFLEKQRSDR